MNLIVRLFLVWSLVAVPFVQVQAGSTAAAPVSVGATGATNTSTSSTASNASVQELAGVTQHNPKNGNFISTKFESKSPEEISRFIFAMWLTNSNYQLDEARPSNNELSAKVQQMRTQTEAIMTFSDEGRPKFWENVQRNLEYIESIPKSSEALLTFSKVVQEKGLADLLTASARIDSEQRIEANLEEEKRQNDQIAQKAKMDGAKDKVVQNVFLTLRIGIVTTMFVITNGASISSLAAILFSASFTYYMNNRMLEFETKFFQAENSVRGGVLKLAGLMAPKFSEKLAEHKALKTSTQLLTFYAFNIGIATAYTAALNITNIAQVNAWLSLDLMTLESILFKALLVSLAFSPFELFRMNYRYQITDQRTANRIGFGMGVIASLLAPVIYLSSGALSGNFNAASITGIITMGVSSLIGFTFLLGNGPHYVEKLGKMSNKAGQFTKGVASILKDSPAKAKDLSLTAKNKISALAKQAHIQSKTSFYKYGVQGTRAASIYFAINLEDITRSHHSIQMLNDLLNTKFDMVAKASSNSPSNLCGGRYTGL
ncbi:MAG: hypothetical protein AB8E15_02350 [Bdellovibrionales bacterium]